MFQAVGVQVAQRRGHFRGDSHRFSKRQGTTRQFIAQRFFRGAGGWFDSVHLRVHHCQVIWWKPNGMIPTASNTPRGNSKVTGSQSSPTQV